MPKKRKPGRPKTGFYVAQSFRLTPEDRAHIARIKERLIVAGGRNVKDVHALRYALQFASAMSAN